MANYCEINSASGNGIIQIGDTYQNLVFVKKGTGTANEQYGTYGSTLATVTWSGASGDNPLLAVRANAGVALYGKSKSGNEHTWRLVFDSGTTYTYYIFTQASKYSAGSSGLVVYDSAGKVIFDSNRKYMRVVGQLGAGISSSMGISSSKTYAIAPCMSSVRMDVNGQSTGGGATQRTIIQYFNVCLINPTTVNSYESKIYQYTETVGGNVTNNTYGESASSFLVLDVSNY